MREFIAILLCLCLAAGCKSVGNPPDNGDYGELIEQLELPRYEEGELMPRLNGSTALIPLAEALYALILDVPRSEAAKIVDFGGTYSSYRALLDDYADLILVYESAIASDKWELAPIGRDALVFTVNESNPIDNLTTEQVRQIYTGEITNWSELGGDDVQIQVFQRNADSASQTLFMRLVMGGTEPMKPEVYHIPTGMGGMIESVVEFNNTRAAIGFSTFYYSHNVNPQDGIKLLSIDGVQPSRNSIRDGSYPHVSEIFAGICKSAKENSFERKIFDWLQSPQGRALIESENYVSIGE
jgi:phosphate transport system substrate-binding protein